MIATAFHPNGRWLASGGGDQKVILLWNGDNGEILATLEGNGTTINAVAFSKDGKRISWGQTAKFTSINNRGPLEYGFDLHKLERLQGGLPETDAIRAQENVGDISVKVQRDGDNRMAVKKGWKQISTIEHGQKGIYWHSAYSLTPDGRFLLTGGPNGEFLIYTIEGKRIGRLIGDTGMITALAISADGNWALSGSNDQTLKL